MWHQKKEDGEAAVEKMTGAIPMPAQFPLQSEGKNWERNFPLETSCNMGEKKILNLTYLLLYVIKMAVHLKKN